MDNIACRIFKEQIDLLTSLPNQEEAKTILYQAIINSLNQFEKQNENQIENQFENAYISESVSVLGISILNLLSKNIIWKEFSNNYGGKRENSGRKSNAGQVIDKDNICLPYGKLEDNSLKDKDIDKDNNKEIYNIYFEEFWNLYTPIKCDGRFVAKGDKKASLAKFIKILQKGEDYENIIRGTKQYIDYCKENNQLTCGVPVFLNQERWKNDYSGSTCQSSERGKRQEPRSIIETYAEIAAEYA